MDNITLDRPPEPAGYGATCRNCHQSIMESDIDVQHVEGNFDDTPIWLGVRKTVETITGHWIEVPSRGRVKIPWCECKRDQLHIDAGGNHFADLDFGEGIKRTPVIPRFNHTSKTISYGLIDVKVPVPKETIKPNLEQAT